MRELCFCLCLVLPACASHTIRCDGRLLPVNVPEADVPTRGQVTPPRSDEAPASSASTPQSASGLGFGLRFESGPGTGPASRTWSTPTSEPVSRTGFESGSVPVSGIGPASLSAATSSGRAP
jgi:hypothetical protein